MSAQKRARLDDAGNSARCGDQAASMPTGFAREDQGEEVGTDERFAATPNSSSTSTDAVLNSSSSSYSKPGRGLPVELLIKIVQAPAKLKQRDYFQWALASRVFLQPALDKLHEHAHLDIEEAIVDDNVAYLTPEDHIGWGGQQPDPTGDLGPEVEDPAGGLMLNEWADLRHLLASLVNLDELKIDWFKATRHLNIDFGALPNVRNMTLSQSYPTLVAAAPRLVRLTTPLYSYQGVPECSPPPLRELVLNELPDDLDTESMAWRYLAWLTPSTLTSLDIVTHDGAASNILPFLKANLARWPSFRTLRLDKPKGRSLAGRVARLAEVRALGEAHGFELCEREAKAQAHGGYEDYGDDGGWGEDLYFPHGEVPGGVDFW
ncbi:hypothetical protein JCM8208_002157 [Rhodotorula glutinis]